MVQTPDGDVTLDCRARRSRQSGERAGGHRRALASWACRSTRSRAAPAAIRPAEQRGEVTRLRRDVLVYDDSYNASPSALKRTLQIIGADTTGRRRVAFLGEMLELGESAETLHRDCGDAVAAAESPGS